jgi:hypothetical protein
LLRTDGKSLFSVFYILGVTSLTNRVLNGGCFIFYIYDSTKYPLTDNTKTVLFDAILVLIVIAFMGFKRDLRHTNESMMKKVLLRFLIY